MKKHIAAKVLAAASIAWVGLTINASATLLVYEGFDYEPAFENADPGDNQGTGSEYILTGKGGTTEVGLSGTWENAVNDAHNMYLVQESLVFGDLLTTGNHVRYRNNLNSDRFHRVISADLAGSSELWFSFLANKLQNNFNAAREGVGITSGVVNDARFDEINASGLHGFGIAPISNGTAWTAYGWNGTAATVGGASFTVPTNGSQTNLLIGRIEYNVGTDGKDVFTLYHYDRDFVEGSVTVDMDNLVQITSIEVDVDESLLGTLNVTRQVNTAFDEIRIGTTLDDVLGFIPPPTGTVITLK